MSTTPRSDDEPSSELVAWLKRKAHEASAVEGIQKDWLVAAAIVTALESLTDSVDRLNEIATRLERRLP